MRWSSEQQQIALSMKKDGATNVAIAKQVGRSPDMVSRFFQRRRDGHASQRTALVIQILKEQRPVYTPQEVLAERDRRLSAPRTIDMILNGTPKAGQSALERRRAVA